MSKYSFKSYEPIYDQLYLNEKKVLESAISHIKNIQHVGSTAIKGLGGKGIIDILLVVLFKDMATARQSLEAVGYLYNSNFSSSIRYFFKKEKKDYHGTLHTYHIHLTYKETGIGEEMILFRDFLNAHPDLKQEYSEIKKKASLEALEDGKIYRQLKDPFIQKVKKQMIEWKNS